MKDWQSKITPLQIAGIIACLSAAFLCISLGTVGILSYQHNSVSTALLGVTDNLNKTLENINRECGAGKPCGTLADVAKTLNTMRMTVGAVEIAANHEDRNLATLDRQEADLFAGTHTALAGVNGELTAAQEATKALTGTANAATVTLAGAGTTITSLQPRLEAVLGDSDALLMRVTSTVGDADNLFTSPDVKRRLSNFAGMTANLDASTGDFQTRFHALLFPKPCATFGCRLARAYPYIKGAAEMGEAGYGTSQLFQNRAP